jgi:tetratricopeptide (TPR) repeat protein
MNSKFIATAFCMSMFFLHAAKVSAQKDISSKELNHLVSQCQNLSSSYSLRGRFFMQRQNYAMAAEDFSKAISLDQDRDDLHLWLGKALFLSGNHQKAVESFDQAAAIADKKIAEIYKTRGEACLAKAWAAGSNSDADKIIESFDRLLLLHPDSAEAYYGRGRGFFLKSYFSTKDYSNAIDDFKKAIALKPNFQEAERDLDSAMLHQAAGDGKLSLE